MGVYVRYALNRRRAKIEHAGVACVARLWPVLPEGLGGHGRPASHIPRCQPGPPHFITQRQCAANAGQLQQMVTTTQFRQHNHDVRTQRTQGKNAVRHSAASVPRSTTDWHRTTPKLPEYQRPTFDCVPCRSDYLPTRKGICLSIFPCFAPQPSRISGHPLVGTPTPRHLQAPFVSWTCLLQRLACRSH